jgi:hypothetical protein
LHFRQKRVFPSVAGCFFKKERFFFDLIFKKMKPRAAKLAKRSPIVVFTSIFIKNYHARFRCKQNVGASAQDFKAIAVVLLKRKNPPLPEGRGG